MSIINASSIIGLISNLRANPAFNPTGPVLILRDCRFVAANAGTGSFVVGSPIDGFTLPENTGIIDGIFYNYIATDGNNYESGDGIYNSATDTFKRIVVLASSNNDSIVDFANPPSVTITYATTLPPQNGRLIKSTFFTSSTTWTKDTKSKTGIFFVTGGGGGSGNTNGSQSGSGGAGAGGTAISVLDISAVISASVTIGSGGTAHNGGGQSSIAGLGISGNGGGGSSDTALDSTSGGGSGGGATGQLPISGGNGSNGLTANGGVGGSSFWGGQGGAFGAGASGSSQGGGGQTGRPGAAWILEFS